MKHIRSYYKSFGFILALLIVASISLFYYTAAVRDSYQNEIILSLEEVSAQSQRVLQTMVDGKKELMIETARRMSALYDIVNIYELTGTLESTRKDNGFLRMGIITPDGAAYTTDRETMSLMDRGYVKHALAGETGISEPMTDRAGGGEINVYYTPIYKDGGICAVLFGTYAISEMEKQMTISSFDNQGYAYIVTLDGRCVVNPTLEGKSIGKNNIYEVLNQYSEKNLIQSNQMKQELLEGQEGYIKFEHDGYQYMYYAPLGINDWQLLTVAPAKILDEKMNTALSLTYILSFFLILIFITIVIYIVQAHKNSKKELLQLIYTDEITGGYSYAKFKAAAFGIMQRTPAEKMYVLNIDIDDFKFVNETFGYDKGDALIRHIHKNLAMWRKSGEIYARQGADVFVALIFADSKDEVRERLDVLCSMLQSYFSDGSDKIPIVPSIGVFQMKDEKKSVDFCLDCATMARNLVKGHYNSYYAFYDRKLRQQLRLDRKMETDMEEALRNGEFLVYYQPKYDAFTKEIVGAEALVRWEQQDGSVLPPGQFIPLFEKNGFIAQLDEFVYATVCQQQKNWMDMGYEILPISVNLSRIKLYDPKFVNRYVEILENLQIPIKCLEVEITESVFIEKQHRILEAVNNLHHAGFVIVMDDFGTGYSSMSMLKTLPFDCLKLDKSFADDIGDERGDMIINGILQLTHSLGLRVVAEGVETPEQYEYLKHCKCDTIQGYLFAKPMPQPEYTKLLKKDGRNIEIS